MFYFFVLTKINFKYVFSFVFCCIFGFVLIRLGCFVGFWMFLDCLDFRYFLNCFDLVFFFKFVFFFFFSFFIIIFFFIFIIIIIIFIIFFLFLIFCFKLEIRNERYFESEKKINSEVGHPYTRIWKIIIIFSICYFFVLILNTLLSGLHSKWMEPFGSLYFSFLVGFGVLDN